MHCDNMDVNQLRKEYKKYNDEYEDELKSRRVAETLQTSSGKGNRIDRLTYTDWLLEQILLSLRKS
jgi:hypothetical protein